MTDDSDLTITSLEDVEALMKKLGIPRSSGHHPVYRGQVKDWPLLSGLGRIDKSMAEIEMLEKPLLLAFEERVKLECPKLLQEFGFAEKYPEGKLWSLLFQAQHLELPTRLLDWSSSMHTAVAFAVDSEPDFDGVLWIYNCPVILNDYRKVEYLSLQLSQINSLLTINHPFQSEMDENTGEKRRAKQNGIFTVQDLNLVQTPLEQQLNLVGQLKKVVIPKQAKFVLKCELAKNQKATRRLMVKRHKKVKDIVISLKSEYDIRFRNIC